MTSVYYKKKPFICPVCGKDFKTKRQLKAHIKDSHGKENNGKKV